MATCKWCGKNTADNQRETMECDFCWELRWRVENTPELTLRMMGLDWVSCEERLPEEHGYYLVWMPGLNDLDAAVFDVAYFDAEGWSWINAIVPMGTQPISHWREIEPPKEKP